MNWLLILIGLLFAIGFGFVIYERVSKRKLWPEGDEIDHTQTEADRDQMRNEAWMTVMRSPQAPH